MPMTPLAKRAGRPLPAQADLRLRKRCFQATAFGRCLVGPGCRTLSADPQKNRNPGLTGRIPPLHLSGATDSGSRGACQGAAL
jgi:hypothetical protein